MKRFHSFIFPAAFILTAATGLAVATWSSLAMPCENRVTAAVSSPTGSRRAVVFSRSCGATTGSSTHVSVFAQGHELGNDSGNLFIADNLGDGGGSNLRVTWKSDDALYIEHPSSARVFKREASLDGIGAEYAAAN